MKMIYVKGTGQCNLNCSHCFTSGRDGIRDRWDIEATQQWLLDYIKLKPTEDYHFELHGGEIFLRPVKELKQFCKPFVNLNNVSIAATSNLVFKLTGAHIDLIRNEFEGYIGTSWDSNIRFENDKQYNLWLKNLKTLVDEGFKVKVFVSVTRHLTESDPNKFLDTLESFGNVSVALERLTLGGNAKKNIAIFPDNETQDNWYLSVYREYKKRKMSCNIVTLDILETRLKTNTTKVDTNCRDCEQNLTTINSDGTLSGCPNTADEFKYSSLEDGVEDYLYSEGRLDRIAKELTPDAGCLACDVYAQCGGDCHQLGWDGNRCGGLKNTIRWIMGKTIPLKNL